MFCHNQKSRYMVEYLTERLEHTLSHAREYPCHHRIKKDQKYNGVVNEDVGDFLLESAASSEFYVGRNNRKRRTYDYLDSDERNMEGILLLTIAFKENKNIKDYYNYIYNGDATAFYDCFELKTLEDYKTFYDILYSFNTICGTSKLGRKFINKNEFITLGEMEEKISPEYGIDILKIAIKDIIRTTKRDNLSLEESSLLYLFLKANISQHFQIINEIDDVTFNDQFLLKANAIENIYFNFLCNNFNITNDELNSYVKVNEEDRSTPFMSFHFYLQGEDDLYDKTKVESYKKLLQLYPFIKNIEWTCEGFDNDIGIFDENTKKLSLN